MLCYNSVILICMTGGSAAMFCNVHNVYPRELYLTVHQEANWEIILFVRPPNVVGENGLAFQSLKSSSDFLRKSCPTILANGNARDSVTLAMPLDYDKVTFSLGLLPLPCAAQDSLPFLSHLFCDTQLGSFCCGLQDKAAQVTQIYAAGSMLVAAAILQALQKPLLFHFPVYKLLFTMYWQQP